MEQNNYHCSFIANATAENAYAAIAKVDAWWAKNFKGNALNVGNTFTVEFGTTKIAFEISDAVSGKEITWKVTDCYLPWLNNKTEWNNTEIVWEITPADEGVKIDMTHFGLTPATECYQDCKTGWDRHIKESLLKLITVGVGQPE